MLSATFVVERIVGSSITNRHPGGSGIKSETRPKASTIPENMILS
jgi:hypothetical protein